jgi:hypothetical protein
MGSPGRASWITRGLVSHTEEHYLYPGSNGKCWTRDLDQAGLLWSDLHLKKPSQGWLQGPRGKATQLTGQERRWWLTRVGVRVWTGVVGLRDI